MAFWKKIFKSKYTGAEIDAAVAKAGTVPAVTSADAGKALVVDDEGKIVAGEAGGGNIFEVVFSFNEDESISCNHTYNEIRAAIADNNTIIARTAYYEDSICNYFSVIIPGSEIKFIADYGEPTHNEATGTSFMNFSHIELIYTADGITNNYSAYKWDIQDFS
jgi:hypothetical protein